MPKVNLCFLETSSGEHSLPGTSHPRTGTFCCSAVIRSFGELSSIVMASIKLCALIFMLHMAWDR